MSDRIAELTDKEKEALRLLLAGHDAKSSATELDISVHTVNDRLRNARRKMRVSSSREAARILGDAEGSTPQNPAHEAFGIAAQDSQADTADLINTKRAGLFGLTWLAGGMLIMSLVIAAAIVGVVYFSDDNGASSDAAVAGAEVAAEQAEVEKPDSYARAEAFLAEVDAGDWTGSYDVAGPYFQSQVSATGWTEMVEPVRKPLGSVDSRRLASVERPSTLPGAPEGEYELLQFETEFSEREIIAIETVVMLNGEDGWEVVGFFIR